MTDCTDLDCTEFPCVSDEIKCAWEGYFEGMVQQLIDANKPPPPDTTLIDALLEGVTVFDPEETYQCGEVVLNKDDGGFYESLKNDNTKHTDDSTSWEARKTLAEAMKFVDRLSGQSIIAADYHASCEGGCVAMVDAGKCIAVKTETGEVDECDNPKVIDEYYFSLEDKNTDVPAPDAESWDGPHSRCALLSGSALTGENVCAAMGDLPTGEC